MRRQGLAANARHVIQHLLSPGFCSRIASRDVASTICQALCGGANSSGRPGAVGECLRNMELATLVDALVDYPGGAVQVASIKTRVESAYCISA